MRRFYAFLLVFLYLGFTAGTVWADLRPVLSTAATATDGNRENESKAPEDSEFYTGSFNASAKQPTGAFRFRPAYSQQAKLQQTPVAQLCHPFCKNTYPDSGLLVPLHIIHCVFRI